MVIKRANPETDPVSQEIERAIGDLFRDTPDAKFRSVLILDVPRHVEVFDLDGGPQEVQDVVNYFAKDADFSKTPNGFKEFCAAACRLLYEAYVDNKDQGNARPVGCMAVICQSLQNFMKTKGLLPVDLMDENTVFFVYVSGTSFRVGLSQKAVDKMTKEHWKERTAGVSFH